MKQTADFQYPDLSSWKRHLVDIFSENVFSRHYEDLIFNVSERERRDFKKKLQKLKQKSRSGIASDH